MAVDPTPTASVLVPLLALIVILAVDSVQEGDSLYYRLFVGAIGIGSIGPIIIVASWSALPVFDEISALRATFYTAISIFGITVLIVGTSMVEVTRGLDDREGSKLAKVLGATLTLWYVILLLLM